MTSVLILGTSHVAALWMGWRAIEADWPGVTVKCFAAPGKYGIAAKLRGNRYGFFGRDAPKMPVFGHDSGAVTLTDFDHVVRAGRSFAEVAMVPILQEYAIDGLTPPGSDRPRMMSHRAGLAMIGALAAGGVPAEDWRGWDSPKLTLLQNPYPDSRFATKELGPRHEQRQWLARRPEEMLALRPVFLHALATALALHDIGFVAQPAETIGDDGLSQLRFSEGSISMADGKIHDDTDLLHMNADYGALAMTRLLEYLTGDTQRRPVTAATA